MAFKGARAAFLGVRNALHSTPAMKIALFGVLFIILGIVQAVYHFKNATGENRYSSFDIVEDDEEPDPLNARFGDVSQGGPAVGGGDFRFCPYCGAKLGSDFTYCGKCGRKLPDIP